MGLALFGPAHDRNCRDDEADESRFPAVFIQERYGLHKRLFRMYEFRTMVPDAEKLQAGLESRNEAQGPVFKIRDDPRITTMGRLLRRTSLDELPQFFNVLRGAMSLVGPRPLPKRDVARFDKASLMRRFSMKPGLTVPVAGEWAEQYNVFILDRTRPQVHRQLVPLAGFQDPGQDDYRCASRDGCRVSVASRPPPANIIPESHRVAGFIAEGMWSCPQL